MEPEEKARLSELRNNVYAARDMVESNYSFMMYNDKYRSVDDMHEKVLNLLEEYNDLLHSILILS